MSAQDAARSADQERLAAAVPLWRQAAIPVFALALAALLLVAVPLNWTRWVGGGGSVWTDDAALRGDLTPLSARVGGYVRRVEVSDYAAVRAGELLVEMVDDDYRAQLAQAEANLAGAEAAVGNNAAQQALQLATIRAAEAGVEANRADLRRYRLEFDRQRVLVQTAASSHQTMEQADANAARTAAAVAQSEAQADAQRRQLDVLRTQAWQLRAAVDAQRAAVSLARISLGYTRITAPTDGTVGERQVRPGQLVSAGAQVVPFVPAHSLWVVANFKETQLTHVVAGQRATVTVDTFPGMSWPGHVDRVAPASGSQFALLPPDNATGNFTKVVQRVPVKIVLDADGPALDRLRPGLSVTARIETAPPATSGAAAAE